MRSISAFSSGHVTGGSANDVATAKRLCRQSAISRHRNSDSRCKSAVGLRLRLSHNLLSELAHLQLQHGLGGEDVTVALLEGNQRCICNNITSHTPSHATMTASFVSTQLGYQSCSSPPGKNDSFSKSSSTSCLRCSNTRRSELLLAGEQGDRGEESNASPSVQTRKHPHLLLYHNYYDHGQIVTSL